MNATMDEEARREALLVLQRKHQLAPEDVAFLVACLGDESWRVRKEAVETSIMFHQPSIVHALIDGLGAGDNAGMRNACQEALTRIGAPAVLPLRDAFAGADADVRKFILDIIGDMGIGDTCQFLVSATEDRDENVVIAACENLGKLGCEDAVMPLLKMLDAGDQWRAFVIIESLAKIGRPIDASFLLPLWSMAPLRKPLLDIVPLAGSPYDVRLVRQALNDSSPYIREAAAVVLLRIVSRSQDRLDEFARECAPVLPPAQDFRKLLDGTRPERLRAFGLLAFIACTAEYLESFVAAADDDALMFFSRLARTAPLRSPDMLAPLLDRFTDMRLSFLVYLCGFLGVEAARPAIVGFCGSSSEQVRQAVAFAVGRFGATEALPCLFRLLGDSVKQVRDEAAGTMAGLIVSQGVPTADQIVEAFDAGDEAVQLSILDIVVKAGGFNRDFMRRAMRSPFASVRARAIDLAATEHEKLRGYDLSVFLTDESEAVRIATVRAFAASGSPAAAPALLSLLDTDSIALKKAVIGALFRIAPDQLKAHEFLVLTPTHPMILLELCDLYRQGLDIPSESLVKAARELDDPGIYRELYRAFLDRGSETAVRHLYDQLCSYHCGDRQRTDEMLGIDPGTEVFR